MKNALTGLLFLFSASFASAGELSLTGTAEVNTKPDIAYISIGVVTEDAAALKATAGTNSKTEAVIKELKELGVKDTDMQTTRLTVSPKYNDKGDELVGYVVSNTLTITLCDITKLGNVLDRMLNVGANRLNGISFSSTKKDQLQLEAKVQAVKNATTKAEAIAEAAGQRLKRVMLISEEHDYFPHQGGMYAADAAPGRSRSIAVQPGELKISALINIKWEIVQKN